MPNAMNRTAEYDFTVIVPVYDEEDNIERLGAEPGAGSRNRRAATTAAANFRSL